MNRRTLLRGFLPNQKTTIATMPPSAPRPPRPLYFSTGLEPYTGSWDFDKAAHLLRRAMYAPTFGQINDAVSTGMNATIDLLFATLPLPSPPVNNNYTDDPNVAIGETWIHAPYDAGDLNFKPYRNASLRSWTANLIRTEGVHIREKMTLFWHNHFPTAGIDDPKYDYNYIELLRRYAIGNFKDLAKEITINPSMLRYLNGNQNTFEAPNENYARELLELFTIGKGELAGEGDYTNYTEDDVAACAKILTGWRDAGYNTINPDLMVQSRFRNNRHDQSDKQLSHRFNNAIITNNGDQEYADLIDVIFLQDEVARYICREFYKWFIYYEIDASVEANVIEPMATMLIQNNYEVEPVLRALLSSEHFYDVNNIGCMIKNPYDFVMTGLKTFKVAFPTEPAYLQFLNSRLEDFTILLQMQYYEPPSVSGWKAYYQEPLYYRHWVNSVTLPERIKYNDLLSLTGVRIVIRGDNNEIIFDFTVIIDVLSFIDDVFAEYYSTSPPPAGAPDPNDPNVVITEFGKILFPVALTSSQNDYLKEILIPGLPDFEWTVEFGMYKEDPNNEDLKTSIENKLRNLLQAMLSFPEYQLQ